MKNFMQFAALLAASALIACPTPSTDDQNGVKVDKNTVTLLAGIDGYFGENGDLHLEGIFKKVSLLDPKPKLGLLGKGSSSGGGFSSGKGPKMIIPISDLINPNSGTSTTSTTTTNNGTSTNGLSVVSVDGKNYSPDDVSDKIKGGTGETTITTTTTTDGGTTTTVQNITDDKGVTRRVVISDGGGLQTRISYDGTDPNSNPTSLTITVQPEVLSQNSTPPLRDSNASGSVFTSDTLPSGVTIDPGTGSLTIDKNTVLPGTYTLTISETITTADGSTVREIPVGITVAQEPEPSPVPASVTATVGTQSVSIDTGIPGGSVTNGSLPAGLTIGSDGIITGLPEAEGSSVLTVSDGISSTTVTITVSDSNAGQTIVTVTEPSQGTSVTKTVTTYPAPGGSVTETTIETTSGGSTSTVSAFYEVEETPDGTFTTATVTNADGSSKITVTENHGSTVTVTVTEKNPDGTVIRKTTETTTTVTDGTTGAVTKTTVRTGDNYWNPRTNSNDISDGGDVFFLSPDGSLSIASQSDTVYSTLVNISGSCISDMRSNYKGGHRVFSVSRDSSGAVSEVSVTYTNGAEVPLPVNPAITLAPKYKTDPSDSSKLVQIPYARAELWYKILPSGSETSASVWHKAATVTGSALTANTINAPLRLFGPVNIPAASQGDSILFLLYLVDEDGSASGEQPVEGEAEPVVSPPDTKTVVIGSSDSSAEFNGTAYTSPYLYRVVYNGKKALK